MPRTLMLALASAIAFGFAAGAPAAAEEFSQRVIAEEYSQRVTYAELDLNDSAGADVLLRRIEDAAESMCGARYGPMPLNEYVAIQSCVQEKSAKAVADVNNGNVTARFYRRDPSIIVASR